MFIFTNARAYLTEAWQRLHNRSVFNLYRSRQIPTTDTIARMFSWLEIPILEQDWKTAISTVGFNSYAITKGVEPDENKIAIESDSILGNNARTSMRITVVNTINNKALGDACMEYFKTNGWTYINEVRTFLTITPYHRVHLLKRIVASNNTNGTRYNTLPIYEYMLFSNRIDDAVWVRLSAAMLHDMEPFVDPDLTRRMISALGSDNAIRYANLFEEACEKLLGSANDKAFNDIADMLDERIKNTVVRSITEKIARTEREIEERLERYVQSVKALQQNKDMMVGVQARADSIGLTDFIKQCKSSIKYISYVENRLFIIYRTPLLYWDENMFNILWQSNMHNRVNNPEREDLKYMTKKVFADKTHIMWMEEAFYIYTNGSDDRVHYIARENIPYQSSNYQPPHYLGIENPHHKEFDCWGDNVAQIKRAIIDSDFPRALAQIFAAVAGINFSDSTVINRFYERVLDEHRRTQRTCIQDKKTGEFMTIERLYERRAEYETNETNEQASE